MSKDASLTEAIDTFLDYLRIRKGRTTATINTYRSALFQFVVFTGNIPVGDLSVAIIDDYANSLDCKPKTLKNKLSPIRSFISYLYAKELTDIRPQSIDLPVVKEIEANFLNDDEQHDFLHACKNTKERALVLLLLTSGMRVSELVEAHYDDLYHRSIVVRNGKGGKPRSTFITKEAEKAVSELHSNMTFDQTYLFPSVTGKKISRQYIARTISEIALRAGIMKKVSPHTLRHTFCTNMLKRGARIEDVQPVMGHANIRTTRIYMHFTNDYLHGRYDEIMAKPAPKY